MYFHCGEKNMHAKGNNMKNMDEISLWNKKLSMVQEKIMENMDEFFFWEKKNPLLRKKSWKIWMILFLKEKNYPH
jgi:hypothetical protein